MKSPIFMSIFLILPSLVRAAGCHLCWLQRYFHFYRYVHISRLPDRHFHIIQKFRHRILRILRRMAQRERECSRRMWFPLSWAREWDIMSQKQSDATLGYERIVDTETGNIYKIDNGFTDWYDGSRYKSIIDDQYTDSVEAVIHWK